MTCPACSTIQANIDYDQAEIIYDDAAISSANADKTAAQSSLSYYEGLWFNCGCTGPMAVPGRVPLTDSQLQDLLDKSTRDRAESDRLRAIRDELFNELEDLRKVRDACDGNPIHD